MREANVALEKEARELCVYNNKIYKKNQNYKYLPINEVLKHESEERVAEGLFIGAWWEDPNKRSITVASPRTPSMRWGGDKKAIRRSACERVWNYCITLYDVQCIHTLDTWGNKRNVFLINSPRLELWRTSCSSLSCILQSSRNYFEEIASRPRHSNIHTLEMASIIFMKNRC